MPDVLDFSSKAEQVAEPLDFSDQAEPLDFSSQAIEPSSMDSADAPISGAQKRDALVKEMAAERRKGQLAESFGHVVGTLEATAKAITSPIEFVKQTERGVEAAATLISGSPKELTVKPSEIMQRPLVPIPEIPKQDSTAGKVAAGVGNAVISFANFMQTPEGAAMLGIGALPEAVRRGITAAIAGQMATHAPDSFKAAVEAVGKGDIQAVAQHTTEFLGGTALSALAGKHATEPSLAIKLREADAPLTADAVEGKGFELPKEPAKPAEPVAPTLPLEPSDPKMAPEPVEPVKAAPVVVSEPTTAPKTQESLVGMGGAIPAEFELSPKTPTGIKNATVDQERVTRGLPAAMQPTRRTFGTVWDQAMAKIDQDPGYPDRLLGELREKPRALTDIEDATVLHRQIDLQNEYGKATRDLAQAFDDGRLDDVADQKVRVAGLSDQLLDLYNIGKAAGTETGRGLAARKMMAYEDFSLAKMELEKRAAKGGEQLTDAERSEVTELNRKIEATQKAYDDYVAKTEDRIRQMEIDRAYRQATQQQEPILDQRAKSLAERIVSSLEKQADESRTYLHGKLFTIGPDVLFHLSRIGAAQIARGALEFSRWSGAMIGEFGERIQPYLKEVFDASNKLLDATAEKVVGAKEAKRARRAATGEEAADKQADISTRLKEKFASNELDAVTPLVQRLARLFVEQGVKERDLLIDAVHGVLKEVSPEITRRKTMDAISGYGDFRQLTKDEISVQLRDLKGQMQQVAKLEDIQERKPPLKTGVERRAPSDEERRLIKLVNEAKRRFGIVVTDPATQLKSALESRKTYYRNQISDLEAQIAAKEKFVKEKSASPTDTELDTLRAKSKELREEFDSIFGKPGLSDAQRLEAMGKHIAALEAKIAAGDLSTAPAKVNRPLPPELEQAKQRLEALNKELKELRASATPKTSADVRRLQAMLKQKGELEAKIASGDYSSKPTNINRPLPPELEQVRQQIEALNRQLAELRKKPAEQKAAEQVTKQIEALHKRIAEKEAKLAAGDISSAPQKVNRPQIPAIEIAKQRLEALSEQLAEMRKAATPKKSAEDIALQTLKTRLRSSIAKMEDQLKRGDFSKRTPFKPVLDADAQKLSYEAAKVKARWHEGLMKDRLARRTLPQKILGTVGEVLNTSRVILTSLDLSAVLRQGGFVTFGHPIRAVKAFPGMFRAFRSEAGQHAVTQEIIARKNYPLYLQSKLYLAEHGQKLSQMEETYMSRWADKIPLVAGSQRAYVTFLNKLRADSFDAMVNTLSRDGTVTPTEAKAIANFVNVATGRGKVGFTDNAAVGLSTVFFAPRYVASRFQLVAGQPLYRGTARTRKLVATEYARFLMGVGIVYGLGQLAGGEVETDSRSSDFGKVRFDNTRIDPMAGILQPTVLLSRLASGETKRLSGAVVPIRGRGVPFGGDDAADVTARFLRTKLSPVIGMGVNVLSGSDVTGKPVTPETATENLLVPLALQDIYKTMVEQGVPKGTAMGLLSIFGMGLQTYDNR